MTSLPVIDFTPMTSTDQAERLRLAADLRAACLANGFFYAAGTGVSAEAMSDVLAAAEEFFALPEAAKHAVSKKKSPCGRGYETLRGQRLEAGAQADLKEGFVMGIDLPADDPRVLAGWPQHGANQWPDGMAAWRERVKRYHTSMVGLADTIMRGLALSLAVDELSVNEHLAEMFRITRAA